jgi:ATP-dependent DNA helicase RecQ
VALIHGDPDERLERARLSSTPTFGNLREHPREWLTRLLRRCVTAGWVSFAGADRPVVLLTEEGRAVMKGDRPARLLLPTATVERATAPGARQPRRSGAARTPETDELDATGQSLFQALRAWRLGVAREASIAPFMVASDRTLRDIARLRPRNDDELAMAYGIGRQKAERYGAAVLRVVAEAARA